MATTFHIEQKGFWKRNFTYEFVSRLGQVDFLYAPVSDQFVIDTQSSAQNATSILVYRIKHLGRGFQVFLNGKSMDVLVNYLSTEADIENAFYLMKAVMDHTNIKCITMNDEHEIYSVSELEKAFQMYRRANIRRFELIDYKRKVMTITGVYNPIYMDVDRWQFMNGKERLDDFTQSLNLLQQVPGIYVMPEITQDMWLVTLTTDTPLIIPKKAFLPIGMEMLDLPDNQYVQFYSYETEDVIARLPYSRFIEYIQIIPIGLREYDEFYYSIEGMSRHYLQTMLKRTGVR